VASIHELDRKRRELEALAKKTGSAATRAAAEQVRQQMKNSPEAQRARATANGRGLPRHGR